MIFDNYAHVPLILIAAVISIVGHEVAHGYVALWNGDPTAKINGRLTLNPFAHFNVVGLIMMVAIGFGFANPVPVNPNNFKNLRRGIFTVAIAGVCVNFVLAIIAAGFYILFALVVPVGALALFFFYMMYLNAGLILFNLLPIYPLDGFRIVEAFTYHTNKYCRFMRNYGFIVLIFLIFLGDILDFFVGRGILPPAIMYLDILGTDLIILREYLLSPFIWLWSKIFGVA